MGHALVGMFLGLWLGVPGTLDECGIRLGPLTTVGYDRQVVGRITARNAAQLCACIGQAEPGSARITYMIDSHGKVPHAFTTPDLPAGRCMAELIRGWDFPSSGTCGYAQVEQLVHWVD